MYRYQKLKQRPTREQTSQIPIVTLTLKYFSSCWETLVGTSKKNPQFPPYTHTHTSDEDYRLILLTTIHQISRIQHTLMWKA